MLDDPVYFGAHLGATVGSKRKESARWKAISTSDNLSIETTTSLILYGGCSAINAAALGVGLRGDIF